MATVSTFSAASAVEVVPLPQPQVFINFCGEDLRNDFISHLVRIFEEQHIKYYIDENELHSESIDILLQKIKDSKIALAIISERYEESDWCLHELVEIVENMRTGILRVNRIFFKVKAEDVRDQKGSFGAKLYVQGRSNRPKMSQWVDAQVCCH